MNVPYTVKVPVDIALKLRDREIALRAKLTEELERVARRGSAEERAAVQDRLKHVSIQNLLRVTISAGFPAAARMTNDDLLNKMIAGGVVRGRPRRGA